MKSVHNPLYWGFFTTNSLLKSISWHNIPPRSPHKREDKKQFSSPISYYCCPIKVFQWKKILFKIVCNGYGGALKEKHIEWNLSEKFYNAIDVLCCFFF